MGRPKPTINANASPAATAGRSSGRTGWKCKSRPSPLTASLKTKPIRSGWAITDGSAGLRGEVIKSDNLADIKLFAATFLSGAAGALTEKQQTVFGPVNSPTLNNAPFAGAQAVLQTYAQQIFDSIQKNGFYVRVPSGKQFYLYVLQTIDAADASLGGTAIPVTQENDEQPNQIKTMKAYYLIPLLFLSACSTTPKLVLRPQQPPATNADGIRYPEVLHAYHVGRYADPNDDLIMHEQHVVYRVEENTRWDFHPGPADGNLPALPSRDAAFAPAPVNDAHSGRGQFAAARHHPNHDAGPNPVGGSGAISNRVAADQNQFAGNGGVARHGEGYETAPRRP